MPPYLYVVGGLCFIVFLFFAHFGKNTLMTVFLQETNGKWCSEVWSIIGIVILITSAVYQEFIKRFKKISLAPKKTSLKENKRNRRSFRWRYGQVGKKDSKRNEDELVFASLFLSLVLALL